MKLKERRGIHKKFYREGRGILFSLFIICTLCSWMAWHFQPYRLVFALVVVVSLIIIGLALNFFRSPVRHNPHIGKDGAVTSPADGKIVAAEVVYEGRYLKQEALKVSVFMSLYSVHANWVPVEGTIELVEHTEGNFHKAFLPKSSLENEHSSVIIRTPGGKRILVEQIAGAVARRITTYVQPGDPVNINDKLGFIRFGSRVDIYLPPDAVLEHSIGTSVTGGMTLLGYLPL